MQKQTNKQPQTVTLSSEQPVECFGNYIQDAEQWPLNGLNSESQEQTWDLELGAGTAGSQGMSKHPGEKGYWAHV